MKRVLILMVIVLAGCTSVPADVADSIDVLRDNTHALSKSYSELLERAGPPALPPGPAGETDAARVERRTVHEAAWRRHVRHERTLMQANNTLADRVQTWAAIEAGREKEKTDAGNQD